MVGKALPRVPRGNVKGYYSGAEKPGGDGEDDTRA